MVCLLCMKMVDIAGLSDQVTVTVGAFADQYQVLKGKTVDVSCSIAVYLFLYLSRVYLYMVLIYLQIYFIDHEKTVYLSDAKLILASDTLQPGSLLVADNVLVPGAPDYLEFIESSPLFSTARHEVAIGGPTSTTVDAISVASYLGASAI